MAEAVGVEPTRADLESAVLTVRPRLENETTARHIVYYIQNKIVKFAACVWVSFAIFCLLYNLEDYSRIIKLGRLGSF